MKLKHREPIAVLFTTAWCPFCRVFWPTFEAAMNEHHITTGTVDLSEGENPLWNTFHISVVATVIFFNNGEAVTRKDGILGRGLSRRDLDELLMMSPTASAPK